MGVIRSSGFRKICIGETALLFSTLAFVAVSILVEVFGSVSGESDKKGFLNDVLYILFSGTAFLSFLLIMSGIVECGTDCKSIRRARLLILMQLVLTVVSVILDGVSSFFPLYTPVLFLDIIIGTVYYFSSFLGLLYLIGGFREVWYICGGDKMTGKSITSLQIQYAVSTSVIMAILMGIIGFGLIGYGTQNPSEAFIIAAKWAAVIGFPAIIIIAVWKVVIHIRLVRVSWRVTKAIDEISGG